MSTYEWGGGSGYFDAARKWVPQHVPGAGDTAMIGSGLVGAMCTTIGATIQIGGTDSGAPPALSLNDVSTALVTMPAMLPTSAPWTPPPPEYARINVHGDVAIGSIDIGAFSSISRAPDPYGHGVITANDNLTVNITAGATLDTAFSVKDGSTLHVQGGGTTQFDAGDSRIVGGTVVIDAPLLGQGSIAMTPGALNSESGFGDVGSLELGGRVAAGETIDITAGHLEIDHPLAFKGTLDIAATQTTVPFGAQSIMLDGLSATSYGFNDHTHVLTLFDGDTVVDRIHFASDVTAARFAGGYSPGGLTASQTASGVFISGQFEAMQDTPLPVHG